MPLDLPAPRDEPLGRSPLKLAVCQIRFTTAPAASKLPAGQSIHQALGGTNNWRLAPAASRTLSITQAGDEPPATALEAERGWRVSSDPSGWVASLMPSHVSLETTKYKDWKDFSGQFRRILQAVKRTVRPEAVARVGLRYIDRIEDPVITDATAWAGWIRPEILGILTHPELGPGVAATQQQVTIDAGGGYQANVRHGFSRDEDSGAFPYIMDFDAFCEGVRAFDPTALAADIERLHELALQLFQAMITGDLYDYLLRREP